MNKYFLLVICAAELCAFDASAQKYSVADGYVKFFSSAPLEDITAVNKKVKSIFNSESAEIVFSIPINQFMFQKKLMQEHFNEKYMDSEKYPYSTFSGKLSNYEVANEGEQHVTAVGKLTLHGVARDVSIPGTIQRITNGFIMKSVFQVKLKDFAVEIPKLMWQNIAEEVEVALELMYKPQ